MAIRRLERHKPHVIYKLADGTPAVGASTIAGINKPVGPLMGWAWKLGKLGRDYRKETQAAADYGSIAHFMIDCHLTGDEPDLSEFTAEEIKIAQLAYDKFLDYWSKHDYEMVANELPLTSEKYRYGGTLDLVCRDRSTNSCFLNDWKTSKAIYESHIMQAVGYKYLWDEHSEQGNLTTPIDRVAIVRVGRKANEKFEIYWVPPDMVEKYWNAFIARLAVYNADKQLHYITKK
jgi:hypothetical protein